MPELENRDELERTVTRDLNRQFRELRADIARNGRRPTEAKIESEADDAFRKALPAIFAIGAGAMLGWIGTEIYRRYTFKAPLVDAEFQRLNDVINVQASAERWARRYGPRAGRRLAARARRSMGKYDSAAEGVENGIFGRDHARFYGVTETTAANTAGELYIVSRLRRRGFKISATWMNEKGACPRCRRLRLLPEILWRRDAPWGPPLHPWCRCWLFYALDGVTFL